MFLVFLRKKQRCRLKLDDSVTRKKAGGMRRTEALTHTGAFTQRSLYTEELHTHTQKVLHREVFTLRSFCTHTSRSFYTQKLLHREVFTQRALTHSHVYTQKLLHRETFTQRVFTHGIFYTQRNLYTDVLSHREAFTHRRKILHKEVFT